MIKIYEAKISDFTEADYTKMYSLLDCAIREKIDAKAKNEDKIRSLAGYILLYQGAMELYGKSEFEITFNDLGKPFCDFCNFNISHSYDRVVCVFSDRLIGVDIQKILAITPRKEYKFFNEKECRYVNQYTKDISKRYIEIFTKKEAALKMKGLSLSYISQIDTFSNKFNFETKITDDFVVTICYQN